jgi:LPS export ABC transporter protein LptC
MRYFRWILLSVFFVLLFAEIWLGFPAILEKKEADSNVEKSALLSDSSVASAAEKHMEGVHYVESRSGNRDWELFAKSAEGSEGDGEWNLKNVKVHFYSNDKIEFTVTGDDGRIDAKSKDMRISGKVLIISKNGYRMQTDAVEYESQVRIIRSLDRVNLTGPQDSNGKGITVRGNWMEAFVDQNLMRLKNDVVAKKVLQNGKTFTVKSGVAEFSGTNKEVRFVDQVAVEMDSMKLEGPEAKFQYAQGADALKSVLINGGVRISDLDKYATADSVSFDPGQNQFTLQGHPRVVQNNDEITGDKIILMDGGKKVKVEKMKARVEKLEE